ncbi:hypothetical protein LWI28_017294 [Acer negundo]|uniref:BED-type domain-containing protein n=1 Tax=Acer negundo TaxID=4023 RepID=A0AAD5JTI7_ACENE|nr:hypothetical protein LWI28_017294 [Acer negundo]
MEDGRTTTVANQTTIALEINITAAINLVEEISFGRELRLLMALNFGKEISQIGEQNVVKETVGLDLDKSSNKKHKKLRSDVWKNFEKYKDENGKDWAKCNICKKPFNGSSKMGTTHLKNHFKSCSQNKSNEGGGSGSGDKRAENSVMDQQLNQDRVKMLLKQCSRLEPLPTSIETADLINVYKEEKEKLRIYFEKLPCRLSLMIDIDTSVCEECICFSVHFIDDDWKLKEKIISLKCIGGNITFTEIFKNVLSEWGIDNNISYMVLDDYTYGDVLSSNDRENGFSSQGSLLFNGKLFCIPDFDSISWINSEYMQYIFYDRMKEIYKYIEGNGNFRIAIDRATSLGKKVTTGVIPTEEDLEDWDFVGLVEMGLGLKETFFELEKMDIEFKSINLTKEEWDLIPSCVKHLFYDCETANMYFPWLCDIYTISLELVKLKPSICEDKRFLFIRDGMKCWYDDNLVLAVAAVLDPRFKMDIVEHWYKKIYGGECETRIAKFKKYLTDVYNEYAKGTNNIQSSASGSKEKKSTISYEMLDPSGKPCKFSHDHLDHHRSPNFELDWYLKDVKFPLFQDFNILEWWRFNTRYFPTLARMTRDFLSIQIAIPEAHLYPRIPEPHMHFDSHMVKEEAFMCVSDWLKMVACPRAELLTLGSVLPRRKLVVTSLAQSSLSRGISARVQRGSSSALTVSGGRVVTFHKAVNQQHAILECPFLGK